MSPKPSTTSVPSISCPPDKSITHRVLFFAAMAKGRSRVARPLISGDTRATMNCLASLGVRFHESSDGVEIESPGIAGWHRRPSAPLYAGNSGTTARFLAGVLSACPGMEAVITGDASLSRRPMRRVLDLLEQAGAAGTASDTLPVAIHGRNLSAFDVKSPHGSAQVKTAMILAALTCDGVSRVTLPDGSRNHTEILCAKLGLPVTASRSGGVETVTIDGPAEIKPFDVTVPGDPSSAAFIVAAALLTGTGVTIRGVCGNPLRSAFLDVLEQAGVVVRRTPVASHEFTEPVEDWFIDPAVATRGGFRPAGEIPAAWVPAIIDEIPVLATILAFAPGASLFRGVGELRVKESDRLAGTIRLLEAAGCAARAIGDDLEIAGGLTPGSLKPFEFDPAGDHRLAMAAMVLEMVLDLGAQKKCTISDRSCVEVSFPDFPAVLTSLQTSAQPTSAARKRGILP